jgi:hypothetical protein
MALLMIGGTAASMVALLVLARPASPQPPNVLDIARSSDWP